MLFTTTAALLFPVAIMAVPAQKPATSDHCSPVSYILSEYTRSIHSDYAFVSFNVQSSYTVDSPQSDPVTAGVNCEADGVIISSNGNVCNIQGDKFEGLVFDLRGAQDEVKYRIHHQWKCHGATWESINDIELPPLECNAIEDGKNGETLTCTSKPVIFTPQNVRKLEDDDLKKAAGKAKAAKPTAHPTAKPADCRNPPKCDAA